MANLDDNVADIRTSTSRRTKFSRVTGFADRVFAPVFQRRAGPVGLVVVLTAAGVHAAAHRTAVDLGTLGGTASEAPSISNTGVVVGNSDIAGNAASHGFRWTEGRGMVDLGTLGGVSSAATAVSDDGRFVVGSSVTADGRQHAFRWSRKDGMVDLTPFSWNSTVAAAVGNNGTVAGNSYDPWSGVNRGFVWTERNGMIDLGTLGGGTATVQAISPSGALVVGDSSLAGEIEVHAFVWTRTRGMTDMGTLGGRWSYAEAVNDTGKVVGWSSLGMSSLAHAFAWTDSHAIVDLSAPGSGMSRATAVNSDGAVAGVRYVPTANPRVSVSNACIWTSAGEMIAVGTLGGQFSWPLGFSNNRTMVGLSEMANGSTHAFAWSRTHGLVDLSAPTSAYGIARSVSASGEWAAGVDDGHATLWRLKKDF